jgi:tRNA(fMet)-specific endonuclease VapC
MFVVDTDLMTLLQHGDERVTERFVHASRRVVTTVISRIEILQGRFAAILKAADGQQLQLAHQRLEQSESFLGRVPILPVDARAVEEFDRLRQSKKLKRIGRADLLIAAITLANRATLVSRNLKHFQLVPGLPVENRKD